MVNSTQRSKSSLPHGPIIFVHGTWGQWGREGSRWFDYGGPFHTKLEKTLKAGRHKYIIFPFLWSGSNSFYARDFAAAELANELKIYLRHPGASPIVVAHSHGGNVVLRALHYLGKDAKRLRVVSLATPFLKVFTRNANSVPFILSFLAFLAIYSIFFGVASVSTPQIFDATFSTPWNAFSINWNPFSIRWNDLPRWGKISIIMIENIAAFLLAHVIVSQFFKRLFNPTAKLELPSTVFLDDLRRFFRSKPRAVSKGRAYKLQHAAFYDTTSASTPRILVVRGVDDEASFALAAGQALARLSSFIVLNLVPVLFTVGLAVAAIGSLILWARGDLAGRENLEYFVGLSIMAFAVLSTSIFLLPSVLKSIFFGRELFRTAYMYEIAVDSSPDTLGTVTSITLSPNRPERRHWLRHFIYDHPDCVAVIARWLQKTK